ncbi:hypothetical protein [Nodosilinea sp. E11]|uniref:hypothetical protein n=1 Tax=Nodosilinea sp. E11 TaxID=3037479 RepID=UPI0029349CE4|nr:hypothetical protein [Nodosilinea sp. E11]WOD36928.1 hypothetical protein RRF56_00200 [Nodosilinea sp. E11]
MVLLSSSTVSRKTLIEAVKLIARSLAALSNIMGLDPTHRPKRVYRDEAIALLTLISFVEGTAA